MSQTVAQHAASINQVQTEVKNLDARAESGVNFADERTSTAYQHALIADKDASLALSRATSAHEAAIRETAELHALASAVSAFDDFELQTTVTVLFDADRDVLSAAAQHQLDQIAESLKSTPKFLLAVYGFTDASGAERDNHDLSWHRADSVVRYLMVKHAIPVYRIQSLGLGNQRLADHGHAQEARAKNRRAEVRIYVARRPTELNALAE